MTLYCRNGHRVGPNVITDFGAGTGDYCPECEISLDPPRGTTPTPTMAGIVLALAVFLVSLAFWQMWLS